jgi:hypothetical protein
MAGQSALPCPDYHANREGLVMGVGGSQPTTRRSYSISSLTVIGRMRRGGQGEGSKARSQGNPLLICLLAHAWGIALTLSVRGFPSPAIPNGVHLSIGLAR